MPSITDRDYYQDLLTDQATRLFAPDEVDLEIYRAAAEYKGVLRPTTYVIEFSSLTRVVFEKISVNESDALANQLKVLIFLDSSQFLSVDDSNS